jgi:RNA polymerase sigma factor (sigma-70 family)
MTDTSRDALRRSLILSYADLEARLSRQFGSSDLAKDALQETYIRLSRGRELPPVHKPKSYLLRMAVNIALGILRNGREAVSLDDAKAAFDIADEAPDQHSLLEGHADLEIFRRAVAELTPRRRAILFASRVEHIPSRTIAVRLKISQRLVEIELKHALAHCAQRLDRENVQRFAPKPAQRSSKQGPVGSKD